MTNPIFVAIDTPYLDDALELTRRIKDQVGGIKLGLEFFCANGHHGVHEVQKLGLPIFLDLKLHDIPNTVAKAMQAINTLEPAIVTIHAAGGRAMMEDAKAAAGAHTKVVAVTVLTSLDDHDLNRVGVSDSADLQVARLAALAQEAGLDGIVCSGHEVKAVKKNWKDGFFVVPGLRPAGGTSAENDACSAKAAALVALAGVRRTASAAAYVALLFSASCRFFPDGGIVENRSTSVALFGDSARWRACTPP
jgi:orotidine-5'-phosphate decarboxylase